MARDETSETPYLDCDIVDGDLKEGVAKVIAVLRPEWNLDELRIEDKSTGFINKNYAIVPPDGENGLLLRLVGNFEPGLLTRTTNCMNYLKSRGIGAKLLLTFRNGLVMELLDGEVVTWETIEKVREPVIWRSIAREIARYHSTTDWDDVEKYNIPDIDVLLLKYNKVIVDLYYSGKVPDEHKTGLPTPEEMQKWVEEITASLAAAGAEKRFSHTDSNPTNILIQEGNKVVFVDYDDCTIDFTCTEISRFFATLVGVLDCDFEKLPSAEEEDTFIREYLGERSRLEPNRGQVTDKLVEYYKFLIRKSLLLSWVSGSAAIMFLTQVSTKPVDPELGHKFWNRFLEYKHTIHETFDWN